MEVYKILPKVRGGAQRAEGSVEFDQLVYHCHCIYDKKFMLIIC